MVPFLVAVMVPIFFNTNYISLPLSFTKDIQRFLPLSFPTDTLRFSYTHLIMSGISKTRFPLLSCLRYLFLFSSSARASSVGGICSL
jgi:hypothetical protein